MTEETTAPIEETEEARCARLALVSSHEDVTIDYTNWRGERRLRVVRPIRIAFMANSYHPEYQWLLSAVDREDGKIKSFSLNNIHGWAGAT